MTRRRSLLTLQWAACAAARDEASLYRRGTRGRRVGRLVGVLRAPLSLEKMTYLPDAGMVMYRFHMHKGLKRNFQLMPGAQMARITLPPYSGPVRTFGAVRRLGLDPVPARTRP